MESFLNAINMNNPVAQQSRTQREDLDEDQRLLLENADLGAAIMQLFEVPACSRLSRSLLSAAAPSVPGDAGLRAVVALFDGEQPEAVLAASQDDPDLLHASVAVDFEG